jgi:uncharacterized protein YkwD
MLAPKHSQAPTGHHKKRVGHHHKHTKHYLKTYWPYVPIGFIVAVGLFFGNWNPTTRNGVLSYATEMSISSLLDATNQQRARNGQEPLKINPELAKAAQAKANDMTNRNYWSHNTPDGKEPWVFVQSVGYSYQKAGENLAYGFNSSRDTVVGWMNSPSHRANLLDSVYKEVGFGFANARDYNGSGPETVVVAMYGQPTGSYAPGTEIPIDAKAAPITSQAPIVQEPQTLAVSRLQTLTGGTLPWITLAVGVSMGLLAAYVFVKHSLAFKRFAREGEAFIVHHPFLDIALVSLVMIGYVLLQGHGTIR